MYHREKLSAVAEDLVKMPKIDWDEINKKLPFEQTEEAKKKRRKLFSDFDLVFSHF